MKKSGNLALSIVVMLAVILSGCGSNNNAGSNANSAGNNSTSTDNSKEAKASDKEPVKLTLWGGVPEESGPAEVVKTWNEAHPDIQVEYVRYVNDDAGNTKLDTALTSQSSAPDIFISYGDDKVSRRALAGMTLPLDDLIASQQFDVDGIIGNDNVKKIDGKVHSLPANKSINGVLFNKSALDAANIAVPTAGWTWDDFADMAAKLNTADRKGAFVNPSFDPIAEYILTAAQPTDPYYTADGLSNFNHPAVKKGLELQKQMQESGYTVKWAAALANKLAIQDELLLGRAAMVYGGTFLIRYVKDTTAFPHDFKVAFAPEPQYEKGTNNNIGGMGDMMSINKMTEHPEEAFQFIDWYLKEGDMAMVAGGRLPSNKQANADEVIKLMIGDAEDLFDMDSLKAFLSGAYTFVNRTNLTALAELKTILREETEKYIMNVQSIDETIQAAKSRGDKALQTVK
jgi:multiple sugar transport system substrate-binding protein